MLDSWMVGWFNTALMSFHYTAQALLWDAMILVLIGGSVWMNIHFYRYMKAGAVHGFRLFTLASMFILTAGYILTVYGSLIEPRILTTSEYDILLPLEEELTIVLFSDTHLGPYKGAGFLRRVVERVNAFEPDFIFIPGDFFYSGAIHPDQLHPLQDLHARYGVYASLGNYAFGKDITEYYTGKMELDRSEQIQRILERMGITVLRNEYREVQTGSGAVFIAGVDDAYSGNDRIREAMPEVRKGLPIILLSHSPDILLQAESRRPHLIVSGHTHGGQIRLPFIGALMGLPIQLSDEYAWGKHVIDDDSTIVITRGVGETGPRARLFAPPEVVVIRAKSG